MTNAVMRFLDSSGKTETIAAGLLNSAFPGYTLSFIEHKVDGHRGG